ncbi:MAG: GldG family protein [Patescibacteria group bacterium]|jgi:ABC-type uncharacterized transport system involved in gliding motility auxiliary subunit
MKKNLAVPLFIIITLSIVAVTVMNILFSMITGKLDFSPGQVYSLSTSSRNVLTSFNKPVKITIYESATLPPRLAPIKTDLFDLLDEYKRYGKVQVVTVNPDKDKTLEEQVVKAGVTKIQFSEVENDQFSVKTGFFGAVMSYDKKTEVIPALLTPSNLEYEFTSAIYRLTRANKPRIGIIAKSKFQLLTGLNSVLKKQFDFQLMDFSNMDRYLMDALVYKDDRLTGLSDEELKKLDSFITSGHLVVIFADGVWVDEQLQTQNAGSNINNLLKKYGLTINTDLVLSPYSETATFRIGGVNFITRYPFWLKLTKQDVTSELSFVTSTLSPLMPWTSTVSITKKSNVTAKTLVYAPTPSVLQKDTFQLIPNQIDATYPQNQKNMFSIITQARKGKGTVIVVPNSRFIEDTFIAGTPDESPNIQFVSKLFDTYLSKGSLAGINSRNIQYTQLLDVPDNVKQVVRWVNIGVPSTLLVLYGIWRYLRRRKNS